MKNHTRRRNIIKNHAKNASITSCMNHHHHHHESCIREKTFMMPDGIFLSYSAPLYSNKLLSILLSQSAFMWRKENCGKRNSSTLRKFPNLVLWKYYKLIQITFSTTNHDCSKFPNFNFCAVKVSVKKETQVHWRNLQITGIKEDNTILFLILQQQIMWLFIPIFIFLLFCSVKKQNRKKRN